ncbi:(mono)amine oxidase [Aureococcus anophagefferens]|uniref:(Mono)amine oxidase n=1 Tax=Aureococcus anophagefferens TaxID=44056 RepID=A0ABR1GG91_AURAN
MAAHVGSQRIAADYDVLILGGGCAGLACYEALRAQDLRCAIVESKAFLGGRVRGFAGAEHHDAGAAWVHGASPANPQLALAAAAGVAVSETFPANPWRARPRPSPRATRRRGFAGGDDHGGAAGAAAFVARAHGTMMELWMGASARELQLREFEAQADEDALCGDFPAPRPAAGGMRGVLAPLVAAVPDSAKLLGRRCVAVRTGAAGVRVETLGGDAYACQRCVVALPLGVLGSLPDLRPAPAGGEARAIARLGVGAYAKVLLRFERRWWRDGDGDVAPVPRARGRRRPSSSASTTARTTARSRRPSRATRRARATPRATAAASRACSRRSSGPRAAPPPVVAAHTTDWTNDPDARGAYSFWPAGAGDADVDDLAAPVDGRLFFAGEATSVEYQGSMAGALLSGARAAAEVLDAARGGRAPEHLRI